MSEARPIRIPPLSERGRRVRWTFDVSADVGREERRRGRRRTPERRGRRARADREKGTRKFSIASRATGQCPSGRNPLPRPNPALEATACFPTTVSPAEFCCSARDTSRGAASTGNRCDGQRICATIASGRASHYSWSRHSRSRVIFRRPVLTDTAAAGSQPEATGTGLPTSSHRACRRPPSQQAPNHGALSPRPSRQRAVKRANRRRRSCRSRKKNRITESTKSGALVAGG